MMAIFPDVGEPKFIREISGEIPGLKNYMDRPWFFIGTTKSSSGFVLIAHHCRPAPVDFSTVPLTMEMPIIDRIVLEQKAFRVAHFKNGRAWDYREILIGQCPKCEKIYFSRWQGACP